MYDVNMFLMLVNAHLVVYTLFSNRQDGECAVVVARDRVMVMSVSHSSYLLRVVPWRYPRWKI